MRPLACFSIAAILARTAYSSDEATPCVSLLQELSARVVHQEGTLRKTSLQDVPAGSRVIELQEEKEMPSRPAEPAQASAIPRQLVLTGKPSSLNEMPRLIQENVQRTLALNPGFRTRWLGDEACQAFIGLNFGEKLLSAFKNEHRGSFRGDICRAAVLSLEGGFYMDLDMQMRVSFDELVDNATTFMTAFTADGALLNALLAVEPGSEVMRAHLEAIEDWYAGHQLDAQQDGTSDQWMGPVTLLRGLREVLRRGCPGTSLEGRRAELAWSCGPHHHFRLYEEKELDCSAPLATVECPDERRWNTFQGIKFGIFAPGSERHLVAWPRFATCGTWGCHVGGWDVGS